VLYLAARRDLSKPKLPTLVRSRTFHNNHRIPVRHRRLKKRENIDGIDVSSPMFEIFHAATGIRLYFFGGKCANIFCTPLSRFLVFLSALLESVSLDEPRQSKLLVLASNRSTTREPTW
jgi:hypothetical protein